jgi:hypothetical protein
MQIKTISVVYERKFNLGNYQSATLGCTAWADLDIETDDAEECAGELRDFCREQVKAEHTRLMERKATEEQ